MLFHERLMIVEIIIDVILKKKSLCNVTVNFLVNLFGGLYMDIVELEDIVLLENLHELFLRDNLGLALIDGACIDADLPCNLSCMVIRTNISNALT